MKYSKIIIIDRISHDNKITKIEAKAVIDTYYNMFSYLINDKLINKDYKFGVEECYKLAKE